MTHSPDSDLPHARQPGESSSSDRDWLDAVLHEQLDEHIDEGGFTAKVMAALPSPTTRPVRWHRASQRWLLLGAGAAAGLAATLLLARTGPGVRFSDAAGQWLHELAARVPWDFSSMATVVGLASVPLICVAVAAGTALWACRRALRS